MKQLIFALPIIFSSICITAQTSPNGLNIGVYYSIDQNTGVDRSPTGDWTGYINDYDELNYSFGLKIEKAVNNHFTINSGIGYSDKSYIATYYCMVCDLNAFPPEEIDLEYLEIPVSLRYYIFDNSKFNLFGDIGFLNQIALKTDQEQNGYIISGKVGAGIDYVFTEKFRIQLSADYVNGLTDAFSELNYKTQSMAYRLGIDYSL
ncbi:outer membrane beta-barrel protein [Mangrovivirga cuniculi]|uniref:Outer membrane protein beta-barrel domain-containing protein n=1 Tax=Mangrovivirga cuniculi TaxID=2715131 RepID=A0A4D7JIR9_9BACT|nr:outer membrane beta-barrel protein [Mangrovivirga cuniculi]QCK14883.1 hypothetical protein DCC35_09085 [Mangrovivirga cuniculi]